MESSRRRAEPFVATVEARAAGGLECPVQILFAPLTDGDGRPDRMIGLYQPMALLARLQGRPVERLSTQRLVPAHDHAGGPAVRLAVVDGRRIA
jgi:hypothetical protein